VDFELDHLMLLQFDLVRGFGAFEQEISWAREQAGMVGMFLSNVQRSNRFLGGHADHHLSKSTARERGETVQRARTLGQTWVMKSIGPFPVRK
jgi:hypothetical protein